MQMNESGNMLGTELNKMLKSLTKYAYGPLGLVMNDDGGGRTVMRASSSRAQKREVEYASSLPLQIALYFNVYFSVVWAIGTCFLWPILIYKTNDSNRVWIILIMFAFVMMVLFEVVRLYLAYVGNLSERVPELTGFWLLTLMIESPLSVFLLTIVWLPIDSQTPPLQIAYLLPMQFALQLVHAIFVYVELVLGFFALRVLARFQISRFHYKQFDDYDAPYKNNHNNKID